MSAALPEVHLRPPSPQQDLPLAAVGVYRVVWQSRFGQILIEVAEGVAYVNGERVEPVSDSPNC